MSYREYTDYWGYDPERQKEHVIETRMLREAAKSILEKYARAPEGGWVQAYAAAALESGRYDWGI